ncbi:MAG: alpha-glucuronidase [Bacteroidetes bacterium OLB12]|nr:MAG: alpha-glucuronidase [Bacteroidetes bacterium OLB12]HNU43224.1 alpha-glucuronidase family glycosyl hydrolase [Cyclobacteriaceae bacterium]
MTRFLSLILYLLLPFALRAEDGYRLWLRYDKIPDTRLVNQYKKELTTLSIQGQSPTLTIIRDELNRGLSGLLGYVPKPATGLTGLVIATINSPLIQSLNITTDPTLDEEGYVIRNITHSGKRLLVITAKTEVGLLYGTFHFLRLIQTRQSLQQINIQSSPKIKVRILNHWDNLDGTVERGYAGFSLWNWHKLPGYIDDRYIDYARANASLGINATVLTNVNANALVLTPAYLKKVAALADVFRPYGIKVFLTARFSAPIEIGKLPTADPLQEDVKQWWKDKVTEIYKYVPDFGGFVVKANSEGQPGPQNYKRTHAEGANVLADALAPYKGIVMWRAFVYDDNVPDDRVKQAYAEFMPLDGAFRENVIVQVKNGPLDFQPREPFHPLFGALKKTPLMMEFQITQEYLGQSTSLVYLANLFKEVLDTDTYQYGKGSTVANVLDGSVTQQSLTAMAGVTNIGTDRNWCGHPFAQANWYAFGRLAWNHTLTPKQIAEEWTRMTFSNDQNTVERITTMLDQSWETCVNYMTPLGLHHIMGWSHHYGPAPWIKDKHRADWTSVYYHKADSVGLGFNRTASGSNAIEQYAPEWQTVFSSRQQIPEKYLLWFHHVGWNEKLANGKTLWEELCYRYYAGASQVKQMQLDWEKLKSAIDAERHRHVQQLLAIQYQEATWWRNTCVLYFQTFSKQPIPASLPAPEKSLDYYISLEFPYAPGIKPQW